MSTLPDDWKALLKNTDQRRRDAMIAADVATLRDLLAADLHWTHSSGASDDRDGFLDRIAAGTTRYLALTVADDQASAHGTILLHHGILDGRAVVNGQEKALRNRFLAVWRQSGDGLELLAWQSTGL